MIVRVQDTQNDRAPENDTIERSHPVHSMADASGDTSVEQAVSPDVELLPVSQVDERQYSDIQFVSFITCPIDIPCAM